MTFHQKERQREREREKKAFNLKTKRVKIGKILKGNFGGNNSNGGGKASRKCIYLWRSQRYWHVGKKRGSKERKEGRHPSSVRGKISKGA